MFRCFSLFHRRRTRRTADAHRLAGAVAACPTIGGGAAIAWRLAGREAALVALRAGGGRAAGPQQLFKPGSIDHHNVQIALAVLTVAATVWSDRRRAGRHWAAGALTGLALAIGLEGPASPRHVRRRVSRLATWSTPARRRRCARLAYALAAQRRWSSLSSSASAQPIGGAACATPSRSIPPLPVVHRWAVAGRRLGSLHERTPAVARRGVSQLAASARCSAVFVGDRAALPRRTLCDDGSVGAADLARRTCAKCSRCSPFAPHRRSAGGGSMAFPVRPPSSRSLVLARDARLRRDSAFLVAGAPRSRLAVADDVGHDQGARPTRCGSACRWWPCWRSAACCALRSCEHRRPHAALALAADADGALGRGHRARAGRRSAGDREDSASRRTNACFRIDSYRALAQLPPGLVAAETRLRTVPVWR